jgi:hypothetical protein
MKILAVTCFICSGELPFAPENTHVGDCPALHWTRALVEAVCVLAADGSNALNVIPPGFDRNVHAAPALEAAPMSSAHKRKRRTFTA